MYYLLLVFISVFRISIPVILAVEGCICFLADVCTGLFAYFYLGSTFVLDDASLSPPSPPIMMRCYSVIVFVARIYVLSVFTSSCHEYVRLRL